MGSFELMLNRPPVTKANVTETPKFDIGRMVRTSHFEHSDEEALTAYNFLRFCEDAGIPFRIPGLNIAKKSATGTLTRIAKYSSYWALTVLVRVNDQNAVDEIFDRSSLTRMDTSSIDNLVVCYLDSLRVAIPKIETRDHHHDGNFGILLADEVKKPLWELVDTLAVMVVRHSNSIDTGAQCALKRVVEEFPKYNLPALRLEIACDSLVPESRDRILSRVEYEMTSTSNDVVVDALSAIQVIADRVVTGTKECDSDNEDLMRLLCLAGNMVRWRRDTVVSTTLRTIENVVRTHPWTFVDDIECSVVQGLHRLVSDTAISGCGDMGVQRNENRYEISTKLQIRREAARLAYSLFEHYRQRGDYIPQAILAWEQIGRSDSEFAEIRNQWLGSVTAAC